MNIFYIILFYFIFNCFSDAVNPIVNINGSVKLAFVTACIFPTLGVFYRKYWIKKEKEKHTVYLISEIQNDVRNLLENNINDNCLLKAKLLLKENLLNMFALKILNKEKNQCIGMYNESLIEKVKCEKINKNDFYADTNESEGIEYKQVFTAYEKIYNGIKIKLQELDIELPNFHNNFLDYCSRLSQKEGSDYQINISEEDLKNDTKNKEEFFKNIKINKKNFVIYDIDGAANFYNPQDFKEFYEGCLRSLLIYFEAKKKILQLLKWLSYYIKIETF